MHKDKVVFILKLNSKQNILSIIPIVLTFLWKSCRFLSDQVRFSEFVVLLLGIEFVRLLLGIEFVSFEFCLLQWSAIGGS